MICNCGEFSHELAPFPLQIKHLGFNKYKKSWNGGKICIEKVLESVTENLYHSTDIPSQWQSYNAPNSVLRESYNGDKVRKTLYQFLIVPNSFLKIVISQFRERDSRRSWKPADMDLWNCPSFVIRPQCPAAERPAKLNKLTGAPNSAVVSRILHLPQFGQPKVITCWLLSSRDEFYVDLLISSVIVVAKAACSLPFVFILRRFLFPLSYSQLIYSLFIVTYKHGFSPRTARLRFMKN